VYKYCRDVNKLLVTLGEDTAQFNAKTLRHFLLDYAKQQGNGAIKTMISALRIFLRYLASQDKCLAGLENAIPRIASWHNASLPNYRQQSEVQRILDTCDINMVMGMRDKAVILLLARLGLRAGDVANLNLTDIDWHHGSIIVSGKNRREVRLPLPQEVGDAILNYLKHRRPVADDAVFIRAIAPYRPFHSGSAVSTIVTRAMHKAAIVSSRYGAHILRNTAATQMLKQGASLYQISTVLRHQSFDMTARYTKVDIGLLNLVVQPWPEVLL
jgi:site-specific recombinase XerD